MPVFYRSRLDLNHHLLNDRFPIRHVVRSRNNPRLVPVFAHSFARTVSPRLAQRSSHDGVEASEPPDIMRGARFVTSVNCYELVPPSYDLLAKIRVPSARRVDARSTHVPEWTAIFRVAAFKTPCDAWFWDRSEERGVRLFMMAAL